MSKAPLELLGFLPRPPKAESEGVAKLLDGELLAYASASSVVVVNVQCMNQATALVGGHGSANVTALDWHPITGSAESKLTPPLILASGDTDGRVIIWDVLQGTPIAALEDAFYAGFGSADGGARRLDSVRVPVKALAWSTARNLLTILLAPGYLLLWDYRSGGVVWRRDLGPSDAFNSMQTDPCDRRRVVLSTPAGAFAALRLDAPSVDKIKFQRFQAEIASGTLKCALPGTRDVLLLLLQRELIAFDLEYGQPVASTSLPSGLPAFDAVLGSYGHAVAGVSPLEAGIDALYCSHVDGSVSIWQRKQGTLEYSLKNLVPLAPAMLAKAAGLGAASGSSSSAGSSSLVSIIAGTYSNNNYGGMYDEYGTGGRAPAFEVLRKKLAGGHIPGHIRPLLPFNSSSSSKPSSPREITTTTGPPNTTTAAAIGSNTSSAPTSGGTDVSPSGVLILALAADGALWQWHLPLLSGTTTSSSTKTGGGKENPKPSLKSPEARLLGCHHSLSQTVTAFSAFPGILALPTKNNNNNSNINSSFSPKKSTPSTTSSTTTTTTTAGVCVVGTAAGTLELVTIHRGRLLPLTLSVASSLAVHHHSTPVAGLRWLGPTPRVASFSSQRSESTGDWINTLMLTDFRSGGSFPFRDGGLDKGPLVGLRASPSGAHLLLLFKGLPSEVWATPEGALPFRLRQIDLSFTSVEWILPEKQEKYKTHSSFTTFSSSTSTGLVDVVDDDGEEDLVRWTAPQASTLPSETHQQQHQQQEQPPTSPKFPSEDFPEEKIVFTLSDGRVGVLSVHGRRIQDTKPRMPSWPQLASGEFRATCAASYGHLVFLGGSDGLLVRWDTLSGRTLAVDAGCGRIHGLVIAPISQKESVDQSEIARVAVLAASGAYAVLALDITGQLRPTAATWAAGGATLGRAQGIDWVSLPQPYGSGCVLAVSVENGSLALVDVTGKRKDFSLAINKKPTRNNKILELAPAPKLSSPLLLPRYLRLVLRIMMQRGVPTALLRTAVEVAEASSSASSGEYTDGTTTAAAGYLKIESELRSRLPRGCSAALSPTAKGITTPTAGAAGYSDPMSVISPRSTGSGEVAATGTMAALLESTADRASNSHLNLFNTGVGSPMRSESGIEQAAMKLGYRQSGSSGSGGAPGSGPSGGLSGLGGKSGGTEAVEKLKSFGGAVKTIAKDVASVGKDQLTRKFSSVGRSGSGPVPDDFDPTTLASPSLPPLQHIPLGATLTAGGGGNRRSSIDTPRCSSLVSALATCAKLRCLEYPLSESEMMEYEAALATGSMAQRMELAAVIGGCSEEVRFWQRLPASLKQIHSITSTGSCSDTHSDALLLWSTAVELAEATERSVWHAKLSRRIFEASESLQEKRVLEFLSLGDLQAAVGFLLASPPGRSARFYRDALCTLGMAFACGLSSQAQTDSTTSTNTSGGNQVLDAAARTLFVQAAKIVSANAAGVGDTLLGVPLMCATGEFDDAVSILQDSGMWSYAAALAAGSLPHAARAGPLDRWATHVADAEGRLWTAAGLLVGAGLIGDAAELLVQNGLPDAAAALLDASKEQEELVLMERKEESLSDGVGIGIDEKTAAAVQASYESFISHVLQNI